MDRGGGKLMMCLDTLELLISQCLLCASLSSTCGTFSLIMSCKSGVVKDTPCHNCQFTSENDTSSVKQISLFLLHCFKRNFKYFFSLSLSYLMEYNRDAFYYL